jgi:hypothetical protein
VASVPVPARLTAGQCLLLTRPPFYAAAAAQAEGWPMTRREYGALVGLAREDAEE